MPHLASLPSPCLAEEADKFTYLESLTQFMNIHEYTIHELSFSKTVHSIQCSRLISKALFTRQATSYTNHAHAAHKTSLHMYGTRSIHVKSVLCTAQNETQATRDLPCKHGITHTHLKPQIPKLGK